MTRDELERVALAYLNRFDCTAHKLERHLRTRAARSGAGAEAEPWIEALMERYRASGLIDDARFATNLAERLASGGKSARAIRSRLGARGVSGELVERLMRQRREHEPGGELAAAEAYVKKRRLGRFREPEERAKYWRRDLASLARQGFELDIARRALGPGPSTPDEF
jgi:regulatory protein